MSTRLTFGALLNTVQATANTVTSTLDAANTGVGMLTSFVTAAADNQRIRQVADKEVFIETLIQEKSFEQAQAKLKVQKFCLQSADHAQFYEQSYNTFTSLLRPATTA
jgi:hypothetical protein